MMRTNEEIAADLVWRYVEHLRERAAAGCAEGLTSAELEQLSQALGAASALPNALHTPPCLAREAAVRLQVEERLSGPAPAAPPSAASAPRGASARRWGAGWGMGAAWGTAGLLLAALLSVNAWHRPPTVVRRVRVPVAAPDVQPLDESRAHALIPRMVRDELQPREERDLMWHMLVCPNCFQDFEQFRRGAHPRDTRGELLSRLARR